MTDETKDGGPAFPTNTPEAYSTDDAVYEFPQDGMTLRQYAAIQLRVPDSGTDWLDDMIWQARQDDVAGRALTGLLANSLYDCPPERDISSALAVATAMLGQREKE